MAQEIVNGVTYDVVRIQNPSSGGGGGTGEITVADGADAAVGSKADAPVLDPAIAASLLSYTKGQLAVQQATQSGAAPSPAATKSSLIGAVFSSTPPTLANGQQAALQANALGSLAVTLRGGSSAAAIDVVGGTGADAITGSGGKFTTLSIAHAYNGTTYDRLRGDTVGLRITPSTNAGTDRSVEVGITAVVMMPANANRRWMFIRNDDVRDLFIRFGATATAVIGSGNIRIPPGGYYETGTHCPNEAVSAITATGTVKATAREY